MWRRADWDISAVVSEKLPASLVFYPEDGSRRFIRNLVKYIQIYINPLSAELKPICHLLALLGVHHFLHVSRIRDKSLTLRLIMPYIYIYIYIYVTLVA